MFTDTDKTKQDEGFQENDIISIFKKLTKPLEVSFQTFIL